MATDYMTEKIMEYNLQKFQETGSLDGRFHTSYNILIESLPGAGELAHVISGDAIEPFEVSPFSCEGDSGSVVIADEADDTSTVNVVALLIGAVSENNIFRHSYASLMKRTIEEIEVQYDCIAIPSTLYPRDRQGEIGPIGAGNA
ncbi:uncharacterized protein LOC132717747 [Ruditapes philippinarum]|uniref:uncharacterized protein LOC132717747 n=1 Tax=Ruditapes philippinarum TaxID=129788 RepID=UPI00295C0D19|nr:uncharacterized protein LOC132717747 [Ruditapes philippinarum]